MKTTTEIQKEIDESIRLITKDSLKNEVESIKRKVIFLRQCKLYLEAEPREDFIKSEVAKIKERIKLIPTHFEAWKVGKNLTKHSNPYKSYCNEMNLPGLNASLKYLNYLLDD